MVDGPGFRTSIYCAGCRHKCPSCHNPQSWDFGGGHEMTTEQLMKIIEADPYANVTFSGGDPFEQPAPLAELAQLPPETKVVPGHGGSTTIGHEVATNPFMEI